MSNYGQYTHIKVTLSDVLTELDELGVASTRELLRVDRESTEASVKQLVGEIQGINRARIKVENVFGAQ